MTKPDERIRAYVEELAKPAPVVNRSHVTLLRLYEAHGRETIDQLLREHWAAVRAARWAVMEACQHAYTSRSIGRCYTEYNCSKCGKTKRIDSGD